MFRSTATTKRLLWWLVAGTGGGRTRARIIMALKSVPKNANQLAEELGMDYKTIRHHLAMLQKNGIVVSAGESYALMYFLSSEMEENYALFEEIWDRIGNKVNSSLYGDCRKEYNG